MCTVAPGMGSAWESNIARLIDQANETLSSSANARRRGGVERTLSPCRHHRTAGRDSMPLRPASSSSFRGDRGASYRRGPEGWDASLLIRERAGRGGAGGEGLRMPPPAPAAVAAPFSRLTAARVDGARIDGMEERIKLEVQTVVRRDVNQRVSLSERAAEAVRQRVDGLAEEVASLGDIVRRSNASTETALEQLLAGEQRNRTAITHLEAWRADREGWCVRKSDSLDSLTEDVRSLARRSHNQQKVLDQAVEAQEDLVTSVKSARKVGEVASASSMAPIREHFLKEIEAIRRRLMALEDGATESASTASGATPTAIRSIAEEEASAKAEEVWRNVKTFVRERMAEQAKESSDATVATERRVELHFVEVEQRVDACGSALKTLQKTDKDTSQEIVQVRDMMSALHNELAEGLARVDKELRDLRSQGARHETALEAAATATVTAAAHQNAASDNVSGKEDWSSIMSRIEELERLRELVSSSDPTLGATAASSTTSAEEKVENVTDKVQRLESGAAAASRRLTAFEDSLDEANETIKGHSLKLRCLEGLWREVGSTAKVIENDCSPRDDSGGESTGGGSSAASNSVQKCQESQPQKQHQESPVAGRADERSAVTASTPPVLRTGLSGLLKRLGSNPLSSSQKEVATKATGRGKDAELSTPPPSCGVITESEKQSAPRSDAPDASTRRLGAGHDGVAEAAPLLAQTSRDRDKRLTEADADEEREPRRRHMSDDDDDDVNNATGDSCYVAGDQSLGGSSSMYDVVFSGEPQEPSTPDRRDERHRAAEAGDSASPDGNNNAGGETRVTQHEDGPKCTEDVLSVQQAISVDVDGKNGDKSLQVQADNSRQNLPRDAVPSAATVANASANNTRGATLTSTLTMHPARGGIKPEMLSATKAGAAATSTVATGLPAAREPEESGGSIEGDSAHSRWSLPETRGIGGIGAAGGLHEQRAVWVGGAEDDSVGTVEQAASSVESGGAGRDEDGRSPSRSRVESYDLQRESGGDFMVPFSPDRSTVASDPAESPKGCRKKQSHAEMSKVTVTTSEKVGPETAAADEEVESGELVAPAAHAGGTASAPEIAATRPEGSGGGTEGLRLEEGSALKEFCFSDDDEEEEEEKPGGAGRGDATPEHSSRHTIPPKARLINETEGDGGDGGDGGRKFYRGEFDEGQSGSCSPRSSTRGDGGERDRTPVGGRQRRQRNKGEDRGSGGHGSSSSDDSLSDDHSGSESAGEATRRRNRREALLNPLRSVPGRRTPPSGGERGVVDSAGATPAAGTWATPDFAFSSDDDLDIEFSASERSVERPVERQSPTSPGRKKGEPRARLSCLKH